MTQKLLYIVEFHSTAEQFIASISKDLGMLDLSSPEFRRNPFPAYDQARAVAPVVRDARAGFWLHFDYGSVRQALTDHESFRSGMAAAGLGACSWAHPAKGPIQDL